MCICIAQFWCWCESSEDEKRRPIIIISVKYIYLLSSLIFGILVSSLFFSSLYFIHFFRFSFSWLPLYWYYFYYFHYYSLQPHLLRWCRSYIFPPGATTTMEPATVPMSFNIHCQRPRKRRYCTGKLILLLNGFISWRFFLLLSIFLYCCR